MVERGRSRSNNEEDSMSQLRELRESLEKFQAQVTNQLSELISRAGRIEERLSSLEGKEPSSVRPVTDEEIFAAGAGAKFWIAVYTGGKRAAHEAAITSQLKDPAGNLIYCYRRLDGVTQGPQSPRPAKELFRTKEEAETAPRPSTSKGRRISVRS